MSETNQSHAQEQPTDGPTVNGEALPPPLNPGKKFRRPKGGRQGRPFKVTEETLDKVLAYIRAGSYIETAAVAAGLTKQTFYDWLKRGNKGREKMKNGEPLIKEEVLAVRLLDSLEKTNAEAEVAAIIKINKASHANWQAAAWLLERKNPERWGRREFVKNEVTGAEGGPVKTETTIKTISDEEKREAFKRHYEAMQAEAEAEAAEMAPGAQDATQGEAAPDAQQTDETPE